MAVDYLRDVKPLENIGRNDIYIANHLSSRTAKKIPCNEVKIILEEDGLISEHPVTLQRSGSLADYYNTLADGNNMKRLIGWFIAHVFGRGEFISSDTQPRAIQLASVLASLPEQFQATGNKILNLGGGQPQAGTTEQDIINARAAYEEDELRRDAYNQIASKAGAATAAAQAVWNNQGTPAEIIAAGEDGWSAS